MTDATKATVRTLAAKLKAPAIVLGAVAFWPTIAVAQSLPVTHDQLIEFKNAMQMTAYGLFGIGVAAIALWKIVERFLPERRKHQAALCPLFADPDLKALLTAIAETNNTQLAMLRGNADKLVGLKEICATQTNILQEMSVQMRLHNERLAELRRLQGWRDQTEGER